MRVAIMGSGESGDISVACWRLQARRDIRRARGASPAIQRDGLQVKSVAGDFHVRPKVTDDPAGIARSS